MTRKATSPERAAASSPVYESFVRHESFLKRFISRFLPSQDDVDEVAQESFLKAYAIELLRPIDKPKSFLFQIAKNESLMRLRKQSLKVVEYIEEIDSLPKESMAASTDSSAERNQLLAQLCDVAKVLPTQCRTAFLLRMVYGMSHKEIARKMEISVSTVEKHLALALQRCSQAMAGQREAEGTGMERLGLRRSDGGSV